MPKPRMDGTHKPIKMASVSLLVKNKISAYMRESNAAPNNSLSVILNRLNIVLICNKKRGIGGKL